jgi:hypothetical protein
MLQEEGLHILPSKDGHALAVIVQDKGQTLWLRNFASIGDLLGILDDDVLEKHDRSGISEEFKKKGTYFSKTYGEPEDGLTDVAFKKYVLSR